MDHIVKAVLALGAFAIIYPIANGLGPNIDEKDTDSAAPESEKTSCPIVIRIGPTWLRCLLAAFPIIGVHEIVGEFNSGVFTYNGGRFLLGLAFWPSVFSALNTRIIFNNDGITSKTKIYFWLFVVHNKSTRLTWKGIYSVTYEKKWGINIFKFMKGKDYQLPGFQISSISPNRRNCLIFVTKNCPHNKFTEEAREKLRKMGIWPDDPTL
jgi:hypothetical protein